MIHGCDDDNDHNDNDDHFKMIIIFQQNIYDDKDNQDS